MWKTRKRVRELETKLARANEFINDVLTWKAGIKAEGEASGTNPYTDRARLVSELVNKYKGYSATGCQLVQRIVDTRAAFTMSGGLRAKKTGEGGGPELDFITRLIGSSGLDGQFGQQLAIEKELEGQVLLALDYRPAHDTVSVRFVSWNDTHYEVDYEDDSYTDIRSISWEAEDGRRAYLPLENSVFIKFNSRIHSREGVPTLSGLLQEAEDIDRALRDWRRINRLFASPTPCFRTRTIEEAYDLFDRVLRPGIDWKIGSVFCGPAEYSLVGMSGEGIDSIRGEIETKVKVLAGGSGVPVQFLGFPEFMSNRATADNTMEPVAMVSMSEQRSWLGGFAELFEKAISLRNDASPSSTPLRQGLVAPAIDFITKAEIDRLTGLYLPAFQSGAISRDELLGLLPHVRERAAKNREEESE